MEENNQEYIFALADPRLTDEEKRALYEIGCKIYGVPEWKLDDMHPTTLEEAQVNVSVIHERLRRTKDGEKRADAIMEALLDDRVTTYGRDQVIKANPIDVFTLVSIVNKALKMMSSEKGRLAALARVATDPKQEEKAFIYQCWQDWQKSPSTYVSKAAFSRDMMTKCEYLKSQKKIEDWCRAWGNALPAS